MDSATNPIACNRDDGKCTFIDFDRPKNKMWNVLDPTTLLHDIDYAKAIRTPASKTLFSGTIISAPYDLGPKPCAEQDWRVVLLSRESSNILIYGPADISEFCDDDKRRIVLVVPVHVVWARIFPTHQIFEIRFAKPRRL